MFPIYVFRVDSPFHLTTATVVTDWTEELIDSQVFAKLLNQRIYMDVYLGVNNHEKTEPTRVKSYMAVNPRVNYPVQTEHTYSP